LPFTRAVSPRYGDTGYVAGYKAQSGFNLVGTIAIMELSIGGAGGGNGLTGGRGSYGCSADWPFT